MAENSIDVIEAKKALIPDLYNIVLDYRVGSKKYWKHQYLNIVRTIRRRGKGAQRIRKMGMRGCWCVDCQKYQAKRFILFMLGRGQNEETY